MDVHYLTDSYDEKIARIKEIGAPLNFIFITDAHNELGDGKRAHSAIPMVESMHYILERCPEIACVVNGGDNGNDYDHDPNAYRRSIREYIEALYRLPVPVHNCVGNHDDRLGNCHCNGWDTHTAILPKEMHCICMKYNPTEENYYYVDIDTNERGYRMVFLNTSDLPYYPDESGQIPVDHSEISIKQAEWFEQTALLTDRKILVFSHVPIHAEGIYGNGIDGDISPYDDVFNSPRLYYHAKKCQNVVAMVAGHVHYDNVHIDEFLPTITTGAGYIRVWGQGVPAREPGTPSEALFDVISIKKDWMYITRFGAGADREVPLLRLRSTRWNQPYANT